MTLPTPLELGWSPDAAKLAGDMEGGLTRLDDVLAQAAEAADFILIDTPGGDTALSRAAHGKADVIVTPMNDSFVDFDLLGQVDPVTLDLIRPSIYAETVWESRKIKAASRGKSIDWVVLRNRLAVTEARNRKRLEERRSSPWPSAPVSGSPRPARPGDLSRALPFGLTVADLSPTVRPVPVALSHVAARQELRLLSQFLGLTVQPAEEALAVAS